MNTVTDHLFTHVEYSGKCCLPVPGRPSWNPESQFYTQQREAAKRGIKIERLFLLPFWHLTNDPTVLKQTKLDQDAGITVHHLYIGNLLKEGRLPFTDSLEFSIWDDKLILTRYFAEENHTPLEFIISANEEDLEVAQYNWHFLSTTTIDISKTQKSMNSLDLEEPMLTTAPVADFLSKVLCKGNHIDKEDCQWYHSIWQYLRILDLVSTPTWHGSFYTNQLRKCIGQNPNFSILISGTADYSMLAHVLWTLKNFLIERLNITVLDLCETPLFLCKWYASLLKRQVQTVAEDIFKYEIQKAFDIIVTDAFLTRFPLDMRGSIIKKWHSFLANDGSIITTVRLGGPPEGSPRRGSISQAEQFAKNIRASGRHWRDFLPISIEEIEKRGTAYARTMTSYSAGTSNNVINLFHANGFKVQYAEENEVKGELMPTTYLDIVAVKE